MTEFGLSQLELKNKKVRKKFFYFKKIGTIEKILSALFLISEIPENKGFLKCVFHQFFIVNWCYKSLW